MKRVQAACIFQTLIFSQKPDLGYTREHALRLNREELAHYKATLDRTKTRYRITEESEQPNGSIIVRVRKQYNDKAEVSEYFD